MKNASAVSGRATPTMVPAKWRVDGDADDAAAYAPLSDDRLWAGYSIADLVPPFRAYSRFGVATLRGVGRATAACLVLRHPAFNSLIPHGDPAGVAAILAAAAVAGELPDVTYTLVRAEHLPAVERWYTFPHGRQEMVRMAADAATFRPPPVAARPPAEVERLTLADLPALRDLYAEYPGNAFNDDQLAAGVFYGARAAPDGALLAAGGTHVTAAEYGIAAIGNIYTRPSARGRGYAAAITAAVTAELLVGPYRDVILNVAVANEPAVRLYRGLGFRAHCRYQEGRAVRRPGTVPEVGA